MACFVWSKVQVESGLSLPQILVLKETERLAGDGEFWWGIGSAPKINAVAQAARENRGTLPVLFSLMLSQPRAADKKAAEIHVWRQWENDGVLEDLPPHVLEWSRAHGRQHHYALVCHSPTPLQLLSHPFDSDRYKNLSGNRVGGSQVTALLEGNLEEKSDWRGRYQFGFRATLVKPWLVRLRMPYTTTDVDLWEQWRKQWRGFAAQIKSDRQN